MSKKKVTTTTTTTVTTTTTGTAAKRTYDYFVLDRSGSMGTIWSTTIKSLNQYIANARKTSNELGLKSFVSLSLFDDKHIDVHNFVDINTLTELNENTYRPDGWTALNDAVGRAISKTREYLGKDASADDVQVNITIFTDGYENSSKEYPGQGNAALRRLVEDMKASPFDWNIVYVGAGNQAEVMRAAVNLGVTVSNVAHYTANDAETATTFLSLESARGANLRSYSKGIKAKADYFDGGTQALGDTKTDADQNNK